MSKYVIVPFIFVKLSGSIYIRNITCLINIQLIGQFISVEMTISFTASLGS